MFYRSSGFNQASGTSGAPPAPRLPRLAIGVSSLALISLAPVPVVQAATAAPTVVVSQTSGLDPVGQRLVVTGVGFDESIGIYVAVCVDNGPGRLPTPCIGGVDTTGAASSSAWISSDPPSYAEGLTTPYGPGGSFEVTLQVVATDPKLSVDCREVACSVVTRADHTRTDDRSQDTRTPLSFAVAGAEPAPSVTAPTAPTASPSVPGTPAASSAAAAGVGTAGVGTSGVGTAGMGTAAAAIEASSGSSAPLWLWPIGVVTAAGAVALAVRRTRQRPVSASAATPMSTSPRGPTS